MLSNLKVTAEYMSVRECQVEPIDSKYDWEREPLPIIREGCQADLVGLVCPPKQSEFGVKVGNTLYFRPSISFITILNAMIVVLAFICYTCIAYIFYIIVTIGLIPR